MSDISMKPTLQFSILCDDVRREDNGKFMFIGLFETIGGAKLPLRHPQFHIANRWCKGVGPFKERIRVVEEETGKRLVESKELTFELNGLEHSHTSINRFAGILFERSGKYFVEVLLNEELIISYPLIVKDVQPKKGDAPEVN